MTRLSINLPDEVTKKLAERAIQLGEPNLEQYVEQVLTAEAEIQELLGPSELMFQDDPELLRQLKIGEDSGPAQEISDAEWNNKRRRLIERHSKPSGR